MDRQWTYAQRPPRYPYSGSRLDRRTEELLRYNSVQIFDPRVKELLRYNSLQKFDPRFEELLRYNSQQKLDPRFEELLRYNSEQNLDPRIEELLRYNSVQKFDPRVKELLRYNPLQKFDPRFEELLRYNWQQKLDPRMEELLRYNSLQKFDPLLVRYYWQQNQKQQQYKQNQCPQGKTIDYYKLTSFLDVDASFLTTWKWKRPDSDDQEGKGVAGGRSDVAVVGRRKPPPRRMRFDVGSFFLGQPEQVFGGGSSSRRDEMSKDSKQ